MPIKMDVVLSGMAAHFSSWIFCSFRFSTVRWSSNLHLLYWWVSLSTFILISVGVNLKCIDDDAAQEWSK